jgi:hypothetical protein
VPEHPECVYNGKKFEDVGRVGLLGCRELAALVGYRVVDPVVVGLGEDR